MLVSRQGADPTASIELDGVRYRDVADWHKRAPNGQGHALVLPALRSACSAVGAPSARPRCASQPPPAAASQGPAFAASARPAPLSHAPLVLQHRAAAGYRVHATPRALRAPEGGQRPPAVHGAGATLAPPSTAPHPSPL